MTAGTKQPKPVRHERRIIERPRLIKMLDACEARVILLLAPAGYGRQLSPANGRRHSTARSGSHSPPHTGTL